MPEDFLNLDSVIDDRWLLNEVKRQVGTRFGGYWLDRSAKPFVVRLRIVDATATDRAVVRRLTSDSPRFQVESRRYSMGDYDRFLNHIIHVLDSEEPGNRQGTGYGFLSDKLEIATYRAVGPATLAKVYAQVPADLILFGVVEGPARASHTSRTDYPPYEGGLQVGMVDSSGASAGACTSNFLFKNGSGYWGATAGHCGNTGSGVHMGTFPGFDSAIVLSAYYSDVNEVLSDSATFHVNSSDSTTRIYSAPDFHRTVNSSYFSVQDLVDNVGNITLCFQGITSLNDNCGTLKGFRREQVVYPERSVVGACIGFPNDGGDSGGPVYAVQSDQTAKAAGIVSFTSANPFSPGDMCFTPVGRLLDRHGVSLVRSGNA